MTTIARNTRETIQIAEDSLYPTPVVPSLTSEGRNGTSDVEQGEQPTVIDENYDFDTKRKQVSSKFDH